MDGQLHIRVDLRECLRVEDLKSRTPAIVDRILEVAKKANATVSDYQFRPYEPEEGYTLVVVIEESHFIVQTWPERSFVNIDVMVCNFTRDNTEVARRLAASLRNFFGGNIYFEDETMRGPWDELPQS